VGIVAAMLVAPLLALTQQSVAFMLLGTLCARDQGDILQALSVLFLLATALATLAAVPAALTPAGEGRSAQRRLFAARVAVGVGLIATLVSAALWIPQWWLSPCTQ
jgi:hypothetical protein